MTFAKKLETAMQELELSQKQVCSLTGRSKASVSQYLSGRQVPPEETRRDMALQLGLDEDYFDTSDEDNTKLIVKVERMSVKTAAEHLGMTRDTVRAGLQQGVFPWGYGIKTGENRWTYFINARRFCEIEGIA